MLGKVLQNINDYFVQDYCDLTSISSTKLTVDKPSDFVIGQYVLILGSKLNDGVTKITGITGNELTVETTYGLIAENTKNMLVCGLAIPRAILSLVSEIETYNSKNDGSIKSESLGDYSVTYASADDVSWISVFRNKLAPYKKVYLNLPRMNYDWKCLK